ncbi:hypothetical protein GGS23DRAFT_595538 [Durotheca rogersii]|uniref:uncharacterized protein n=1 Tax=Durotheca rogersii TaxID=419775 RepID=UPI002220C90F|nr:uncharacterized protein GGS23DRAFT_595538 [Durotheca rogersii]KAI5864846.1 hypothetical protein GGS23DRAFT_595538 [Durotheca rogersii]
MRFQSLLAAGPVFMATVMAAPLPTGDNSNSSISINTNSSSYNSNEANITGTQGSEATVTDLYQPEARDAPRVWQRENSSTKFIMQADVRWWISASVRGDVPFVDGRLPRRCRLSRDRCPYDLSDRVYHCSRFGRCLPVYDHFCPSIQSTVYLRAMKPYCSLLVFLPLDAVFFFVVSTAAAGMSSTPLNIPISSSVASSCVILFLVLLSNSPMNLRRLLWENQVWPELKEDLESGGRKWVIAFKHDIEGERKLRLIIDFDQNNYWNLGPSGNFRQVFGRNWWQ